MSICHDQRGITLQYVHRYSVAQPTWRTRTTNVAIPFICLQRPYFSSGRKRYNGNQKATDTQATALHSPQCPQHGPRTLLPSPSACLLLHYLKHSLVFICRAGDVASDSTFPSRAAYIREPIWLYKTRQQKGGGPEPERGETWKPFYGAANCALDSPVH